MKLVFLVLAGLALSTILMVVIGYLLPVKHTAVREAVYDTAPTTLWRVVTDFADAASWRPDVKRVDQVSEGAETLWREANAHGEEILYRTLEWVPHQRLVRQIASKDLPFGGSWTFELFENDQGCRLRITENGEVYNPLYRILSRFIFGHTGTLDRYLRALRAKLDEA